MTRNVYESIVGIMLALLGGCSGFAQNTASVRGIVRSSEGTPQMGVAVALVGSDAQVIANAFTDLNGHFVLRNLAPGVYQLRATATLYLPMLRTGLRLRSGDLSTVNLTLNTLFDQAWPVAAARRGVDQPDDWRWTLRSSANRPLLRVLDEDVAPIFGSVESARGKAQGRSALEVARGDGGFGTSGSQVSFSRQQSLPRTESSTISRFTVLNQRAGLAGLDASLGMETHAQGRPARKIVARIQSRSEIHPAGRNEGTQLLDVASGERIDVGDSGHIEVGNRLRAVHCERAAVVSYPFVRVTAGDSSGWSVGYAAATDPALQAYDDIGSPSTSVPAVGLTSDKLLLERGLHQIVFARRRIGHALVQAAVDRDTMTRVGLLGGNLASATDAEAAAIGLDSGAKQVVTPGAMIDGATGAFRQMHSGYSATGWRMLVSYPLSSSSHIEMEYVDGVALAARSRTGRSSPIVIGAERAKVIRAVVQGSLPKTNTRIRAAYVDQPRRLVSVVSPFTGTPDGTYLSLHLQQPFHTLGLPQGTKLTIDGENMLQQGYVILASTGVTEPAFLASTLRTLRAGLVFTF